MTTSIPSKERAFTLIELLIVVAIIAILAAIAVPNFLEAQVRSKVSRVKADMRSVTTALEAYYVDYNKYPPDYNYFPYVTDRDLRCYLPRLQVLSTPVSFLTAIPEDVFAPAAVHRDPILGGPYRIPYSSGPVIHPMTFDYAYRRTPLGADEETTNPGLWTQRISRSANCQWALRSVGPDLKATVLGGWSADVPTSYDPTNGTVSNGDIFFLGPGLGPEMGPVN